MTVFDNSSHHVLWSPTDKLGDAERVVMSDAIIHSLQDIGVFDIVPITATAPVGPAEGDKWLDTSTAPSTARVYDGTAWQVATFATWFGGGTSTLTHTDAATPPASPGLGDTWQDTDDNVIYMRVNDGSNDVWIEIGRSGGPYLPLTGGTLTGPLVGTSGTFSGAIAAASAAIVGAITGASAAITGAITAATLAVTGTATADTFVISGSYTPGTLPAAAGNTGRIAYITGGLGGGRDEQPVYSDGTNWRKFQNGAIQA